MSAARASRSRTGPAGRRQLAVGSIEGGRWEADRIVHNSSGCPGRGRCSSDTERELLRKVAAASSESSESTPRNATRRRARAAGLEVRELARQGPHHDAHLLTTTGVPVELVELAPRRPSTPPASSSFAWARSSRSSGGAALQRRRPSSTDTSDSGLPRRRVARVVVAAGTAEHEGRGNDPVRDDRHRLVFIRRWGWYSLGRFPLQGPPELPPAGQGKHPPASASTSLLRSLPRLRSRPGEPTQVLSMAKTTDVAASAASVLSDADLERVQEFTREPILLEGETIEDLAPGTARRRAVDAALAELEAGRGAVDRVAAGVLAAARPRAAALGGTVRAARRRRAHRAPGRRALGHARGARRRARAERPGRANGSGNGRHRTSAERTPVRTRTREVDAPTASPSDDGGDDEDDEPIPTASEPRRRREPRSSRPTRSPRTGRSRPTTRTRRSSPRRPRTRGPTGASGSSTRPAPARPSPPSASSRPRAPAAS